MTFDAFLSGLAAGYGISVPVGPIAILILELGIRRGIRIALVAGIGVASAIMVYATGAAFASAFLVAALAPFTSVLRYGSGLILIAIGGWLLYHERNLSNRSARSRLGATSSVSTYLMFLWLALLNPIIATYFVTLILGMSTSLLQSTLSAVLFVFGVFLAALSWHSLLASIAGLARKRLPEKAQAVTFAVGNFVIIAFGIVILLGLPI